jgi:hypothetical protein
MSASLTIPINEILEKAFELRKKQPELTIDELIKEILPTIKLCITSESPISISKKVLGGLYDTERCSSRTFYETKHLDENGLLISVLERDDKNKYGDRCKCRKKEGIMFCTRHAGNQPLGVWNGEYAGKLLDYVTKTTIGIVCQITDDEEPPKPVIKAKQEKVIKEPVVKQRMVRPAEKVIEEYVENIESDEDSVDAYPIKIDGIEYNIDESNNVWTDDGNLVGVYDRIKNIWLSK